VKIAFAVADFHAVGVALARPCTTLVNKESESRAPHFLQHPDHVRAGVLQVLASIVVSVQRNRNEPGVVGQLGEGASVDQGEAHGEDALGAEVVRSVEELVELDPVYHPGFLVEGLEARDEEETAVGGGEGAVQSEGAVGRPRSDGRIVERANEASLFFEASVRGPDREVLVARRDQFRERVEGDERQLELLLTQVQVPNVRPHHPRLELACVQSLL
jgi:hypothetical protein